MSFPRSDKEKENSKGKEGFIPLSKGEISESIFDEFGDVEFAHHEMEYEYILKKDNLYANEGGLKDPQNKKDTSYNNFIMQSLEYFKEPYKIVSCSSNKQYTALLYEKNQIYQVLILINQFDSTSQNVKYTPLDTFNLPQLGEVNENPQFPSPFSPPENTPSNRNSYFPQTSFRSHPSNMLNKNSLVQMISLAQKEVRYYPQVYLCSDNYIILENEELILLVDFICKQVKHLYNKANHRKFNIIFTYDENVYHGKNIDCQKTIRTYVFGVSNGISNELSNEDELYYFIVNNGDIEKEKCTFDVYPSPFDTKEDKKSCVKDIKIVKINHPNPQENKWYFFISILSSQKLIRYVSDWTDMSLQRFMTNIPYLAVKNKLWKKSNTMKNCFHCKRNIKKLYLYNHTKRKSYLLVLNCDKVITISYDHHLSPSEIKERFLMDNSSTDNPEFIFEDNIEFRRKSCSEFGCEKIRTTNSIIQNDEDAFYAALQMKISREMIIDDEVYNMGFYELPSSEIDLFECQISFYDNYLFLMCSKNIWLFERNKEKPIYNYKFSSEVFIDFIQYPECNNPFLVSQKRIFRFRYNERLNLFNEHLQKCIDTGDKEDIFEKDLNSKKIPDTKLSKFSLREYDNIFKNEKIEKLYEMFSKRQQIGKCAVCDLKALIQCPKCRQAAYCCREHLESDKMEFHFFECKLNRFVRVMKYDYEHNDQYAKECINLLIKTIGKIMNKIFKYIHCEQDCQVYLIFIAMIIDIMDKFEFSVFFPNLIRIIGTLPSSSPQHKTEFHIAKIILTEACFFYLHLKLLYVNFAMRSKLYRLGDYLLRIVRDNLNLLKRWGDAKPDQKSLEFKPFNFTGEKITLQIDRRKLEKYSHLFFDMYSYFNCENEKVELFDKFLSHYLNYYSIILKYFLKLSIYQKTFRYHKFIEGLISDIVNIFDERFQDLGHIVLAYSYFLASFYLAEIGKVWLAIGILRKTVNKLNEDNKYIEFKALCYFNLGLLEYAVGEHNAGIHNLEECHRIITEKNLSTYYLIKVLEALSLAYINKKQTRKAFILIQQSISVRNLIVHPEVRRETEKLKAYLNYIIDLVEYEFNNFSKKRNWTVEQQVINRFLETEEDKEALIDYVMGITDKDKQFSDIYCSSFVKTVEFLFNLSKEELAKLNHDNQIKPPLAAPGLNDHQADKALVTSQSSSYFNQKGENSLSTSQSYINAPNKEAIAEEVEHKQNDEIEIKTSFFEFLPRKKQEILKTLNSNLFRRAYLLRDPKGIIDQFNMNYHPIYTHAFQRIIENVRSNFLIKEITKTKEFVHNQDEFFKYDSSNCLIGLSRYLQKEKIQSMIAIEVSKYTSNGLSSKTSELCIRESTSKRTKMKYPDFLTHMIDQLGLYETSYTNDVLYQIYSGLSDDYLHYIMDHPETILNFIYSDTNIFEVDEFANKENDKGIDEEDEKEKDEIFDDESVRSLQRKDNVFRNNALEIQTQIEGTFTDRTENGASSCRSERRNKTIRGSLLSEDIINGKNKMFNRKNIRARTILGGEIVKNLVKKKKNSVLIHDYQYMKDNKICIPQLKLPNSEYKSPPIFSSTGSQNEDSVIKSERIAQINDNVEIYSSKDMKCVNKDILIKNSSEVQLDINREAKEETLNRKLTASSTLKELKSNMDMNNQHMITPSVSNK